MTVTLYHGDCLDILPMLADNTVDSIVTDPPYGLSFMGKDWDHGVPGVAFWEAALRAAKPGAHLLAFGGTRTFHRLACAIEDAGWEIRDTVMWVYGSGFPKSHDVSKAIDKAAGAEREVVGQYRAATQTNNCGTSFNSSGADERGRTIAYITAPATPDAARWSGWGTALKPAWEPVIVARKPLCGTVADNVLTWGTGAINVDGCRVGTTDNLDRVSGSYDGTGFGMAAGNITEAHPAGRWPANLIHDGSDEVVGLLNDAARFFYCAKASKRDRDEGCEELDAKHIGHYAQDEWSREHMGNTPDAKRQPVRNHHPTVKPTALMRYLVRLVTSPEGIVLDPFMGSGSTGKAAIMEGFRFIGIELDAEYLEIARARIAWAQAQVGMRLPL